MSFIFPRQFIMCGPGDQLLAMAPPVWRLQPRGYLMSQVSALQPELILPPGYRIEMSKLGSTFKAAVIAKTGSIAASGYAAEHGQAFVFDRINTHPAHRRRGLGRALMAALGACNGLPGRHLAFPHVDGHFR